MSFRKTKAFDIDGVLVRGPEVLPGARESLRALEDARVPFVFVTNGGGKPGRWTPRVFTRSFSCFLLNPPWGG